MHDPYTILGLPDDCDDAAIRARYLELVRQYPPERHPERAAAIRQAYDELRDVNKRLHHRLFDAGKNESLDVLLEEVQCQAPRRRVPLTQMLEALRKG
jgi:curved DNA-binding protein CbpA